MKGTSVDRAVACLNKGRIVAFPTETYYGLAVDPENSEAVQRLYFIKKRQAEKPLLLLIQKREQLTDLVEEIPREFIPLMEKYWPGALTLVFPASRKVNSFITGGTQTVGIRISPHPVAQRLVEAFGRPVTATSANVSGLTPAAAPGQICDMFGDEVDYILDGGTVSGGLCSTILAAVHGRLLVLRHGQIELSRDELSPKIF